MPVSHYEFPYTEKKSSLHPDESCQAIHLLRSWSHVSSAKSILLPLCLAQSLERGTQ